MVFVENIIEFERWLAQMVKDAKEKLALDDETITWILLKEGTARYFKSLKKPQNSLDPP